MALVSYYLTNKNQKMKTKTLLKNENTSFIEYTDIENLEHEFTFSDFEYQEIKDNTTYNILKSKWALLADSADISSRS